MEGLFSPPAAKGKVVVFLPRCRAPASGTIARMPAPRRQRRGSIIKSGDGRRSRLRERAMLFRGRLRLGGGLRLRGRFGLRLGAITLGLGGLLGGGLGGLLGRALGA